jgi:hypothetical protein
MNDLTVEPDSGLGYICDRCEKHVTASAMPSHPCHDCGGPFRQAAPSDIMCDRCADARGKRLVDRTGEYSRLCEDCIDEVNE